MRGVEVSTEDAKRRDLIMDLLCHMRVQVPETMGDVHAQLQDAIAEGLMKKDGDEYLVTELGRPFIRSLATAFDTHFQSQKTARHSRAV